MNTPHNDLTGMVNELDAKLRSGPSTRRRPKNSVWSCAREFQLQREARKTAERAFGRPLTHEEWAELAVEWDDELRAEGAAESRAGRLRKTAVAVACSCLVGAALFLLSLLGSKP
jgi:hypothetical protein